MTRNLANVLAWKSLRPFLRAQVITFVQDVLCALGAHLLCHKGRCSAVSSFVTRLTHYFSRFQALVCLDAVFSQKNNKHKFRDPPRAHPQSVFIPEDDAKTMEAFVAEVSPVRSHYQNHLKVPNSVLDECEQSFTAADGSREKASTQFFDSTAIMGMLCRHDRVLWLVNMTSAGERQHYTFTLIDMLFRNIPPSWHVGILYDVACTLERSCRKWGFLDQYINRISFAISVFHAYGHAWACQCVYHPRKCEGFGLTDGEGCERFWHSISKLVAYLRVCGVRSPFVCSMLRNLLIHS